MSALYENARDELMDLEHKSAASQNRDSVQIEYDLMPNMPDILGDATMLRQVLHNLMQNAQDALIPVEGSPPIKKPEILVQTSFNESTIKLVVKDNGQGFPAAIISHAYEPYVTTKAHGTGLGLAIVKKMVDEHAGQIRIENNASGGASVTIILPLESDHLKQKNTAQHTEAANGSHSQSMNGNTQQKSVRKV